jgi:uncharacterized protein (DUF488 family)
VALPNIYTIGYEGAAIEDLIASLKAAGVTRLIDARQSPYSKRKEFCRDELSAAVAAYGIAYTHIRELGNPPAGREAAHSGHKAVFREIFTAHLDGADGQKGLALALSVAAYERVCLLCLEKSAMHCHRSLVADRLHAMSGQEIVHLRVEARQPHPAQAAFDFY